MDLHCNKCFCLQTKDYTIKLHITSCRHIICAACMQEKCPVCGKKAKMVLIERNMPPSAASFLHDPMKQFTQLQNTLKFWSDQERSLCAYALNELPRKILQSKKHCKGLQILDARMRERIEVEQKKIDQLTAFLNYEEKKQSSEFAMKPPPKKPKLNSFESSTFNSFEISSISELSGKFNKAVTSNSKKNNRLVPFNDGMDSLNFSLYD